MQSGQRLVGFCVGLLCLTAAQLSGKMTPDFIAVVGGSMTAWISLKTVEGVQATRTAASDPRARIINPTEREPGTPPATGGPST